MSARKVYHGSCVCDAVQITQGAENISTHSKTPLSFRKWCTTCGGHVFTEHPTWGGIDVYAAVIQDFPYQSGIQVNYEETKLRIKDGAAEDEEPA